MTAPTHSLDIPNSEVRVPHSDVPNSESGIPNSEVRVPHSDVGTPTASLLAWAGWQISIPNDWQPLKLKGMPDKGQVIVGDDSCAIFILKWERYSKSRIADGRDWVTDRLKRLGVHGDACPPAEEHFTATGWSRGVQTEEGKETTNWFGYNAEAQLLLGVTVNGVLPEEVRRRVEQEIMPTLRTSSVHAESVWAMYDVSFMVPPHFKLLQRHLYSGDVALEFGRGVADRLLVRQVYPGGLALDRRTLPQWLDVYPFKVHRRLRKGAVREEPWPCELRPELKGIERQAWKRLPVPMGWCAPRKTHAVAVHDTKLDRVLVAELEMPRNVDTKICVRAIEGMNAA